MKHIIISTLLVSLMPRTKGLKISNLMKSSTKHNDRDTAQEFKEFEEEYHKNYASDLEEERKFREFKRNEEKMEEFNKQNHNWKEAINEFTDLTDRQAAERIHLLDEGDEMEEEIEDHNYGHLLAETQESVETETAILPNISWAHTFSDFGYEVLQRPKDQGQCGSCWAYSAISVLEAYQNIKKGRETESLSEQYLIDCDYLDHGCNGGWMPRTLTFAAASYPLTEEEYAEALTNGETCSTIQTKSDVSRGYKYIYKGTYLKALQNGPLLCAVGVCSTWFRYGGGLLDDCNVGTVNHAIVVVGYGEENGMPYWEIRNSWGDWGVDGNIRIPRNPEQSPWDQPHDLGYCYVPDLI